MKRNALYAFAGSLVASSLIIGAAGTASAQTTQNASPQNDWGPGRGAMMRHTPAVFGTVDSVSGTTLTVIAKARPRPNDTGAATNTTAGTVYTVDASNAKVEKVGASAAVSDIAVGDTVMIEGTVNGTSITATQIHDLPAQAGGSPPQGQGPMGGARGEGALSQLQGNGQPVIGGSVMAISGSVLSVAPAQGNLTYSVDASSATVIKDNATSSVSAIAVGDRVVVQGSVTGTSVSATTVIDHTAPATVSGQQTGGQSDQSRGMGRFFGVIGGFFHRLFGFF